ncbi:MAG: hypothetical protein ACL7AX_01250 [Candidatus Arsenophonus phytopathogenicus]
MNFLRGADPGFELLISWRRKGINALKNAAQQAHQKVRGLTPLIKALGKKKCKICRMSRLISLK